MKYGNYTGKVNIVNSCTWLRMVDKYGKMVGYKTSCNHRSFNLNSRFRNCPFCDKVIMKKV